MSDCDQPDVPLPCRQHLRRLELQAYSSLVSVFRAQGDFNSEKKRILNELQYFLNIPLERHQAEIRRAVADENLSQIANSITGEETRIEWLAEGRRLVPLIPRAIPQTKATNKATKTTAVYLKRQHEQNVDNRQLSTSFLKESGNNNAPDKKTLDNKTKLINSCSEGKDTSKNQQTNTIVNVILNTENIDSNAKEHPAKKAKLFKQNEFSYKALPVSIASSSRILSNESSVFEMPNSQSYDQTTSTLVNQNQTFAKVAFAPAIASTSKNYSSIVPSMLSAEPGTSVTAFIASNLPNLSARQAVIATETITTSPVTTTVTVVTNTVTSNLIKDNFKSQCTTIHKPVGQVKFTPTQITIPSTGTAKILSPAPQVVVFSSQSPPKTFTFPVSQNVKALQLPVSVASGTPTIFYQSSVSPSNIVGSSTATIGTVKSIPTGFTIKTFKPGQAPLHLPEKFSGNYIIMPKTVVRSANIRTITIPNKEKNSVSDSLVATPPTTSSDQKQ